jgi:hypothetical protein
MVWFARYIYKAARLIHPPLPPGLAPAQLVNASVGRPLTTLTLDRARPDANDKLTTTSTSTVWILGEFLGLMAGIDN